MKHFAVIGHPIGHSLSPVLHNEVFRLLGLAARYDALDLAPADLPEVARQLRAGELAGINITLPHKTGFLPYLDEVAPEAAAIGAVNCVAVEEGRLVGSNTDLTGLVVALRRSGFEVRGCHGLVLGAGGAARAAVRALLLLGASQICVAARREAPRLELVHDFEPPVGQAILSEQPLGPQLDTAPFQLIINATPVGMWPSDNEAPLLPPQFNSGQVIFDLIYRPENTLLLKMARDRGCQTITGLDMFIAQALGSVEIWFPQTVYGTPGQLHPALELEVLKSLLRTAVEDQAVSLAAETVTGGRS